MTDFLNFLMSALPWIAIGLFVACSCVTVKAKTEGRELGRFFKGFSWSPAFCFFFVAVIEMYSGNRSNGTTWLVLSAFNAIVNFSNFKQETQTQKENGHL